METKRECPMYDLEDVEPRTKVIDIETDEGTTVSVNFDGEIFIRGKARLCTYLHLIQQAVIHNSDTDEVIGIMPDSETAGDSDE